MQLDREEVERKIDEFFRQGGTYQFDNGHEEGTRPSPGDAFKAMVVARSIAKGVARDMKGEADEKADASLSDLETEMDGLRDDATDHMEEKLAEPKAKVEELRAALARAEQALEQATEKANDEYLDELDGIDARQAAGKADIHAALDAAFAKIDDSLGVVRKTSRNGVINTVGQRITHDVNEVMDAGARRLQGVQDGVGHAWEQAKAGFTEGYGEGVQKQSSFGKRAQTLRGGTP